MAYIGTKNYDKAIGDFTETIILEPNNAAAYHNRGIAYLELGKNVQAQADFDKSEAARLHRGAATLEHRHRRLELPIVPDYLHRELWEPFWRQG